MNSFLPAIMISLALCSCTNTSSDNSAPTRNIVENKEHLSKPIPTQYPFANYDSVLAYSFNKRWFGEDNQIITEYKSELNQSAELPGVKLSDDQTMRILQILNDVSTYSGQPGACFDPRMGLVFYGAGKVVAHVSICFECNRLRSFPDINADVYARYAGYFGFGKEGRSKLKAFCTELNLNYCDQHSDLFDN